MFEDIEKKYKVIYPESGNATYHSILNYSTEKDNPFQRWYRYKEGFSVQFVNKIVEEYAEREIHTLLDPFAGSGTTLLAANRMGVNGIGFEVNPFSYFLMKCKLNSYSDTEISDFKRIYTRILDELDSDIFESYLLPLLSISKNVFTEQVETLMLSCKAKIIDFARTEKVKDLLLLGWLSCVEELSVYRKAGNGLKKRKTVKPIIITKEDVLNKLRKQYEMMYCDIVNNEVDPSICNKLFQESSLNFSTKVEKESVDGIIFSPPYANCFDYTEIYKLELWFGDFVSSYDDLKILRKKSLKSHLNVKYEFESLVSSKSVLLNSILERVLNVQLWDKRIPKMLYGYFDDMFNIIDNCYATLVKDGFCAIVVGNSAYGGIVVPTDLILAEYAASLGFKVDKIEVDRFIITSSQQYEMTKENGKYLRESVICLKK